MVIAIVASFVAYDDGGTAGDASDDTGGAIVDTSQGDTHTITAKLTTAAFDALSGTDGLGFDGYDADRTDETESANRADAIVISDGFIVDAVMTPVMSSGGRDVRRMRSSLILFRTFCWKQCKKTEVCE